MANDRRFARGAVGTWCHDLRGLSVVVPGGLAVRRPGGSSAAIRTRASERVARPSVSSGRISQAAPASKAVRRQFRSDGRGNTAVGRGRLAAAGRINTTGRRRGTSVSVALTPARRRRPRSRSLSLRHRAASVRVCLCCRVVVVLDVSSFPFRVIFCRPCVCVCVCTFRGLQGNF